MSALGQKQTCAAHKPMSALPPKADIACDKVRIMNPVTIASVRAHGVRQLLVYCNGKREGDWPCHHHGELPIEQFSAEETLPEIQGRCRCTVCGWRRADLRPDYSKQQTARVSAAYIVPPGTPR